MSSEKTKVFFKVSELDISLGLDLFKLFKVDFKIEKDHLYYDNHINNSCYDSYFLDSVRLKRFYQPMFYENNLETFATMLLDSALNYLTQSMKLDVLDYLLDNKNELKIKDETIVQFLAEKVYDTDAYCKNYNASQAEFIQYKENLVAIVNKLIERNVSFESDTQGYLVQIVAFNEVKDEFKILNSLSQNGSSVTNFLKRYNNTQNWVNYQEELELDNLDANHARQYNIYKKFDFINKISNETVELCNTLSRYEILNQLPEKSASSRKHKI